MSDPESETDAADHRQKRAKVFLKRKLEAVDFAKKDMGSVQPRKSSTHIAQMCRIEI